MKYLSFVEYLLDLQRAGVSIPNISELQVFDLSEIDDFLSSMIEENDVAQAPLFETPAPADKVVFVTRHHAVLLQRDGLEYTTACARSALSLLVQYHNPELPSIFQPEITTAFKAVTKAGVKLASVNHHAYRDQSAAQDTRFNGLTADQVSLMHARLASCACEIVAYPQIFLADQAPFPRAMRRRNPEFSGVTYSRYRFNRNCGRQGAATRAGEPQKKLHYCAGHWRMSDAPTAKEVDGAMRIWVRGHWRGDPALGVHLKTYVAGKGILT